MIGGSAVDLILLFTSALNKSGNAASPRYIRKALFEMLLVSTASRIVLIFPYSIAQLDNELVLLDNISPQESDLRLYGLLSSLPAIRIDVITPNTLTFIYNPTSFSPDLNSS